MPKFFSTDGDVLPTRIGIRGGGDPCDWDFDF